MRRPLFAAIIAAAIVTTCPQTACAKDHPYLFFQKADIPALREKVTTDPVARDALAGMVQRLERPGRGRITLPPLDAEIRTTWSRAVGRSGYTGQIAAFCYLMTGEKKHLDLAREYLLTYARNFDERVNFHLFKDKEYMRIYYTGGLGISAAWTYDMIYDELTPDERELIETKFLRGIVEMVKNAAKEPPSAGNAMVVNDYEWNGGAWNGVVYCNSGIAAIGFALDDPEIYEHAIGNWKTYMGRDQLADGLYVEEDYGYANFCMGSLIDIAEMAHQFGYRDNLWTMRLPSKPHDQWDHNYGKPFPHEGTDPGYRSLESFFDAVLDYQYPNLAPGNWGWQMNRGSFTNSRHYPTFFELAHRRLGKPGYAWALSRLNRKRGRWGGIATILLHQPLPEAPETPETTSRWYNHSKWIALKSIEGKAYWDSDAIYAFMPYGPYRTKALTRLSVDLFAFGKVIAPRVSKTSRHQSADEGYYIYTNAWNNVMVDGQNISIRRGTIADSRMRFQEFSPEIKIAQPILTLERYVRPSIWADETLKREPDEDRTMSRALALTDTYLLDISHVKFLAEPEYKHNFHWNWHAFGELELEHVRHDNLTHDGWSAIWRDTDGIGLRTTMLASGMRCNTKVLWRASPHNQYVRAARSDTDTAFVAVHEPFRDEPRIAKVSELLHADGRVAVRINGDTFTDYLCVAYDADEMTLDADGARIVVNGPYAYIRIADGQITARGKIAGFRLPAENVGKVLLNGKEVAYEEAAGFVVVGE